MQMKKILFSVLMGLAFLPMHVSAQSLSAQGLNYPDGWAVKAPVEKPRVIITADAELDDSNSLIRFLLFSTDYKVEGLIYTSSQFHWKGDGKGTKYWVSGREYDRPGLNFEPMTHYRWDEDNRFIDDVVDAYEKAYPNLKVHNPNYPTPEYIRSKVAWGNVYFDGEFERDTPGSELIKNVLLDDEPGPVFVEAWGGCSTIARALKSIEDIYSQQAGYDKIKKKVSEKLVLYLSGDQDNLYDKYIRPYWPDVKQQPTGHGAPGLSFMSPATAKNDLQKKLYGPEWIKENILSRGEIGALYRVWGDGKQFAKGDIYDPFGFDKTADELRAMGYVLWCPLQPKGTFISEGDTFCFLNLLDNGLKGYVQNWGGWGGYQLPVKPGEQNAGRRGPNARPVIPEAKTPDFLPPVMYSFAERLKWGVTPTFAGANHEPQIAGPTAITAKAGETLKLKYTVTDPDKGQKVNVSWWKHPSCSYEADCNVADPTSANTTFQVPADAKSGDEIHLVLEATDNGNLPLTHYNRLVISVK
jgi:hypothetical protein